MKLIEPNVELIEQEPGIEGMYKHIERCSRICYKSEDKITEDSAKKFVDMLIKNGHGAMLEHGTVYLAIPDVDDTNLWYEIKNKYEKNRYSKVINVATNLGNMCYITTNYRVLIENNWIDDLKYLETPTFHEKRYTFHFVTSIGITREIIRHRHMSFANESTRYCNYNKNKGLEFVKPYWFDNFNKSCDKNCYREDGTTDMFDSRDFIDFLDSCEKTYLCAIIAGAKPQEAREMLPLCTKSEIIMTGFESDWKDFFKLRCDKAAYPDMQIIANKAKELLKF